MRAFVAGWALLWWVAAALAAPPPAAQVLMLTTPDASVAPQTLARALASHAARGGTAATLVVRDVPGDPLAPVDGHAPVMPMDGSYRMIFATSMAIARAAQLRDPHTPIVFEGSADPMLMCLVDSPVRPGRNATGYTSSLLDGPKMLDTLIDGFPQLRQVIVLVSAQNLHPANCQGQPPAPVPRPCVSGLHEPDAFMHRLLRSAPLREQARARGVKVGLLLLCSAADLDWIDRLAAPGVGFIVPYHYLFFAHAHEVVRRIGASRRPAVYGARFFGALGGLITVDTISDDVDDGASVELALKVLDGRDPATMPVLMPRGFEVTVNAWAAAAQGLHPALMLLRRADHIIVQPARR